MTQEESARREIKGKNNHDSVLTIYGAISLRVIAKLRKKKRKKEKRREIEKNLYKRKANFDITTFFNIHSYAHTLSPIDDTLSSINPSITKTVKVHICTQNRIIEATLALSSTQKQEEKTTTAFSPFSFNESIQTTCPTLNIPQSLFNQEAMDFLQFPPNLAASSNSVRMIITINALNMN